MLHLDVMWGPKYTSELDFWKRNFNAMLTIDKNILI